MILSFLVLWQDIGYNRRVLEEYKIKSSFYLYNNKITK